MSVKYLFITGGVVSSLGKGITAASVGTILEDFGYKVAFIKLDPYLNVDPGTMNPFQHGEVYVTEDGAETDLDLGHYFRFTNSPLSKISNATSGQIYYEVLNKERRGEYLGQTVQVIPHITEEIQKRILACQNQDPSIQIVICEIGGTVGDIESLPFLEAIRQFRQGRPTSCLNLHLTYVPYLKAAGELKTKPTQHSVQSLRAIGIIPDMILCRSDEPLEEKLKEKISLFCNVVKDMVIDGPNVKTSIYEVPLKLKEQKLGEKICKFFQLDIPTNPILQKWEGLVNAISNPQKEICIGIVGKYMDHADAYKSVFEALHHAAMRFKAKLTLKKFESDELSKETSFAGCDGILVPGGFGSRGWEGKLLAAKHCRENNVPYFGICLGMQTMLVEFARNVLGFESAHSTEVDPKTSFPIISRISEQKNIQDLGGTMRLGGYPCLLSPGSKVFRIYGKEKVQERHRHRYEFNNQYKKEFEEKGVVFSGVYKEKSLVEVAELAHPWMIGVQFHPEFLSKPLSPHPLFVGFMEAALDKKYG